MRECCDIRAGSALACRGVGKAIVNASLYSAIVHVKVITSYFLVTTKISVHRRSEIPQYHF
jgi:hypothetical protein